MINIYSIYDLEAKTYSQPYFGENDVVATRQFVVSMEKIPEVVVSQLQLMFVGSYDKENMKFEDYKNRIVFKGSDIEEWKMQHSINKEKK